MIILIWLISIFFICLGLSLIVALTWLIIATTKGAPFVPTGNIHLEQMLRLAQITPGDRAIDLGSGDGRLVLAMAKQGAKAEGYEIQPLLVAWSKLQAKLAARTIPTNGSASFYRQNLWQANCRNSQVVTLYAFPSMMLGLEQKLSTELPVGAKVISLSFPFPNWEHSEKIGKVYLYEKRS